MRSRAHVSKLQVLKEQEIRQNSHKNVIKEVRESRVVVVKQRTQEVNSIRQMTRTCVQCKFHYLDSFNKHAEGFLYGLGIDDYLFTLKEKNVNL